MSSWTGASVWCMTDVPNGKWIASTVIKADDFSSEGSGWAFLVSLEDGETTTIYTKPVDRFNLEFEWIKRREVDRVDHVKIDDMTSLTHLNEPEIIECLWQRYKKDFMYTSTGPILLAVNPYKQLPIYDETTIDKYFDAGGSQATTTSALFPHVFQICDNAYRKMLYDKFNPYKRENQSILVNGESGAGKTESTKHCLHYLAVVSSKVASCMGLDSESGDIENQILASNPITESLGNARTTRNNNSSRFGKFIELGYTADGIIDSASIRTYLLESVRVVSHMEGERNFHVFYEIAAALPPAKLQEMGFTSIADFKYTNCTVSSRTVDPMGEEYQHDKANYEVFMEALQTMNVDTDIQEMIVRTAVAVLHIGNLTFTESSAAGDESALYAAEAMNHVRQVCDLLEIEDENLMSAVGRRSISVAGTTTTKTLGVQDAMHAKDNFARHVYSNLFAWVLAAVNDALQSCSGEAIASHIGVLDIFGFEFFEKNSFEQLCINYTNEKLQDHFNNTIFRTEQELYKQEGIAWTFVEYPDNSQRLDLLENKKTGIFALCDERLKLKSAVSHEGLAKDMYVKCAHSPFFHANAQQKRQHQFVMRHFAGDVLYDTALFLEKNRSEVAPELGDCLRASMSSFVRELADGFDSGAEYSSPSRSLSFRLNSPVMKSQSEKVIGGRHSPRFSAPSALTPVKGKVSFLKEEEGTPTPGKGITPPGKRTPVKYSPGLSRATSAIMGTATRGQMRSGQSPKLMPLRRKRLNTVLSQFTKQLHDLMVSIQATRSHFIRCIKPNVWMKPDSFDRQLVMSQLRCGGTLGAVQVFRAGFPNRFEFSSFVDKYSALAFVSGTNPLTKDFYKLRKQAILTGQDFFWSAASEILMRLVPVTEAILTALGVLPHSGSADSIQGEHSSIGTIELSYSMSDVDNSRHALVQEGMCMGRSQIFLRAPVFDYLEQLLHRSCTLVAQLVQRRWRARREVRGAGTKSALQLERSMSSVSRIASAVASFSERKRHLAIHIIASVVIIQRRLRVFIASIRLRRARFMSVWVSSHYRGYRARVGVRRLKNINAASIQRVWRGLVQRTWYRTLKRGVTIIQQWVRRIRYRILRRNEMARMIRAEWGTTRLQSLWRRKSARRTSLSLAAAKENEMRIKREEEIQRREQILGQLIKRFDANPKLMEAFMHDDSLVDTLVAHATKAEDSIETKPPVRSPLHIDSQSSSSPPSDDVACLKQQIAELEAHVESLQEQLQRKRSVFFSCCT